MADYLAVRRNLAVVVQMVDSRHGLTDLDKQLLGFVAPRVANGAVKLLVILTKSDKLNRKESDQILRQTQEQLAEMATDESDIQIALFSALKKQGVGEVADILRTWAQNCRPLDFPDEVLSRPMDEEANDEAGPDPLPTAGDR